MLKVKRFALNYNGFIVNYSEIYWQLMFENSSVPALFFTEKGIIQTSNSIAQKVWSVQDGTTHLSSVLSSNTMNIVQRYLDSPRKESLYFEVKFVDQQLPTTIVSMGDLCLLHCSIPQPLSHAKSRLIQIGQLTADTFHSLSNPLAVIQGRIELMIVATQNENLIRNLKIVFEQCQRITSLSESVKTLSMRAFQISGVNLYSLLNSVLEKNEIVVKLTGIRLLSIQTDPERMKILIILIMRLIKQNGKASLVHIEDKGRSVDIIFNVSLSAHGLEIFYSFDPTRFHNSLEHTGYIVQSLYILILDCLVQVSVFNDERIVLSVPKIIEKQGYIAVQSTENLKNILIVDDNQILRDTLLSLLSNDGHYIFIANSAEEAFELLSPDLDVILMDVRLPKMSGIELLNIIREKDYSLSRKVILISGSEINVPEGTPFLRKPFSRDQLNKAILQLDT
jgi:CheY-like chemotaxis protein